MTGTERREAKRRHEQERHWGAMANLRRTYDQHNPKRSQGCLNDRGSAR